MTGISVKPPIILGYTGMMGSGKTTMANYLAPIAQSFQHNDDNLETIPIIWTKLSLALPIQKMVGAKKDIKGQDKFSRTCFLLHDILHELFPNMMYDELIDLVYEIEAMELDLNSNKPRQFMQKVGDMCRAIDNDIFIDRLIRQIKKEELLLDDNQQLGIVIDDIRFPNEVRAIKSIFDNSYIILLTANTEVLKDRLIQRDGFYNELSTQHDSEKMAQSTEAFYDLKIDTSSLSPKAIHQQVTEFIFPSDNLLSGLDTLVSNN